MDIFNVNGWAILVAAIINMVLGGLWYSPLILGKKWLELSGVREEDLKGDWKAYLGGFIAALVMNYVLALFVYSMDAETILEGAFVGFLAWLGFIATTHLAKVLWEKGHLELFFLHIGIMLIILVVNGAILAVW